MGVSEDALAVHGDSNGGRLPGYRRARGKATGEGATIPRLRASPTTASPRVFRRTGSVSPRLLNSFRHRPPWDSLNAAADENGNHLPQSSPPESAHLSLRRIAQWRSSGEALSAAREALTARSSSAAGGTSSTETTITPLSSTQETMCSSLCVLQRDGVEQDTETHAVKDYTQMNAVEDDAQKHAMEEDRQRPAIEGGTQSTALVSQTQALGTCSPGTNNDSTQTVHQGARIRDFPAWAAHCMDGPGAKNSRGVLRKAASEPRAKKLRGVLRKTASERVERRGMGKQSVTFCEHVLVVEFA